MIKTFADRRTKELYVTGKAKRFPPDVAKRTARKLEYIDLATRLDDLRVPPGNQLHALKGDREECLAAGMDSYIAKPVRNHELMTAISPYIPTGREA